MVTSGVIRSGLLLGLGLGLGLGIGLLAVAGLQQGISKGCLKAGD